MPKTLKRNVRTLTELQLRAEFLGLSCQKSSDRYKLKKAINKFVQRQTGKHASGPKPFLLYLENNDLLEDWERFIGNRWRKL